MSFISTKIQESSRGDLTCLRLPEDGFQAELLIECSEIFCHVSAVALEIAVSVW